MLLAASPSLASHIVRGPVLFESHCYAPVAQDDTLGRYQTRQVVLLADPNTGDAPIPTVGCT